MKWLTAFLLHVTRKVKMLGKDFSPNLYVSNAKET